MQVPSDEYRSMGLCDVCGLSLIFLDKLITLLILRSPNKKKKKRMLFTKKVLSIRFFCCITELKQI